MVERNLYRDENDELYLCTDLSSVDRDSRELCPFFLLALEWIYTRGTGTRFKFDISALVDGTNVAPIRHFSWFRVIPAPVRL